MRWSLLQGNGGKAGGAGEMIKSNWFALQAYSKLGRVERAWFAFQRIPDGATSFSHIDPSKHQHARQRARGSTAVDDPLPVVQPDAVQLFRNRIPVTDDSPRQCRPA